MDNHSPEPVNRKLTFAPPIMAQVALFPVDKPKDSYIERSNGNVTVIITPSKPDQWVYGRIARLILLYTKAKIARKNDPDVDSANRTITFRGSFNSFCRAAGIANGTGTKKEVSDTIMNLTGMSIRIIRTDGCNDGIQLGEQYGWHIAEKGKTTFEEKNGVVAQIQFSEAFWKELSGTSVPLNLDIIARLGRSARTIDIYLWLAYRTNQLDHPMWVTWQQLYEQLENTGMALRNFKIRFRDSLKSIKKVWPGLNVDVTNKGIVVRPSTSSTSIVFDDDVPKVDNTVERVRPSVRALKNEAPQQHQGERVRAAVTKAFANLDELSVNEIVKLASKRLKGSSPSEFDSIVNAVIKECRQTFAAVDEMFGPSGGRHR